VALCVARAVAGNVAVAAAVVASLRSLVRCRAVRTTHAFSFALMK